MCNILSRKYKNEVLQTSNYDNLQFSKITIMLFVLSKMAYNEKCKLPQNRLCPAPKHFNFETELIHFQMLATHIGLLLAQNHNPSFADYYNENQPWCLETCSETCDKCTNVKCSEIVDNNQNPYQCLSEQEAANWHKKCLPANPNLCDYTGKFDSYL